MSSGKPPEPPGPPWDDKEFWEELVSLLLQVVCLIEREKLGKLMTNADLRRAGKQVLCTKVDKE